MTEQVSCQFCGLSSAKHLVQCNDCKVYLCNCIQDGEKYCDIIKHMIKNKHVNYSFPYSLYGQQPKCEVCGAKNPLKLATLPVEGVNRVACVDCFKNERFGVQLSIPTKFLQLSGDLLHGLAPVPTESIKQQAEKIQEQQAELKSKEQDESAKINLQLEQQKFDKQVLDQLSREGIDELVKKMEENAQYLPKIPTRFNITYKDLYRINGQPYAVQQFAEQIADGTVKYDPKTFSLTTEDKMLQVQLQTFLKTPVSYEQIFREAISFDHQYEMLQNKMRQEEKDSNLIYVRANGRSKFFEFIQVGWHRHNTINNVKVQLGDFVEVQLIFDQQIHSFKCSIVENNNILALRCADQIPFDLLKKFKEAIDIEIEGLKFSEVAQESVLANAAMFKDFDVWRLQQNVRILYQKNDDEATIRRQKFALKTIERESERVPLYKLLMGKFQGPIEEQIKKLSTSIVPKVNVDLILANIKQQSQSQLNQTPNEAQEAAIKQSLTSCLSMIQGCPGGGKTYTAACILHGLVQSYQQSQKKAKVLCCAGSNIAADNIALFCKKLNLNAIRVYAKSLDDQNFDYKKLAEIKEMNLTSIIGQKLVDGDYVKQGMLTDLDVTSVQIFMVGELVHEEWAKQQQIAKEEISKEDPAQLLKKLEEYELEQHEIIISTCTSAGQERLNIPFDAVLLDESSQSVEPEQLIPIIRTQKQIVIIGDQNQLGPNVSFPRLNEAGLGRGLYQRLFLIGLRPHQLNIQYRMHSGLLNFPNSNFYVGQIRPGIVDASRVLQAKNKLPFGVARLIDQNFPSLFINVEGTEKQIPISKSFINDQESNFIQQLVRVLSMEYALKHKDIGIITPYSAQQLQILKDMETISPDIEVNSVDGFQGREKDVIIFSAVRTNELGFLWDRRRLNVTMTRAKKLFIVVGNAKALQKCEIWGKMVSYYLSKNAIFSGSSLKDLTKMEKPKKEKDEEK